MRLDQYLVLKGYFDSRNKAANSVKLGHFTVNKKTVVKPSFAVNDDDVVKRQVVEKTYVARSAHKLMKAIQAFQLECTDKVFADLGASTGGFCQVLLEEGAKRIYAVDIGTAQLHPEIKKDERVINMEHTNARYLSVDSFPEQVQFVTADLSFISIKAVLPAIYQVLPQGGEAVVLIKPQFEAGPKFLNKNGVVLDKKIHCKVLEEIAGFAENIGFGICGIAFSGLAGESGNREYLLYLKKDLLSTILIDTAVHEAVFMEENHA